MDTVCLFFHLFPTFVYCQPMESQPTLQRSSRGGLEFLSLLDTVTKRDPCGEHGADNMADGVSRLKEGCR